MDILIFYQCGKSALNECDCIHSMLLGLSNACCLMGICCINLKIFFESALNLNPSLNFLPTGESELNDHLLSHVMGKLPKRKYIRKTSQITKRPKLKIPETQQLPNYTKPSKPLLRKILRTRQCILCKGKELTKYSVSIGNV